jgi:hypothetical protein
MFSVRIIYPITGGRATLIAWYTHLDPATPTSGGPRAMRYWAVWTAAIDTRTDTGLMETARA